MKKLLAGLTTGLSMLFLVGMANAFTVFTDRTSWENAVESFYTETFSNDVAQAGQIILDSGIMSELQDTPLGKSNHVSGGLFTGFVNQTGQHDILWSWDYSSIGPISSFGGDFLRLNPPTGLTVSGDFNGTGSQTISVAATVNNGNGFFGIIGTNTFDTLLWSSMDGSGSISGELFQIDNFSYDGETPVPEPSTVILLSLGLVICAGVRKKRFKK